MKIDLKSLLCFIAILVSWIIFSQEIYFNDVSLGNQALARYIIYFAWTFFTCAIGCIAWAGRFPDWVWKFWIKIYVLNTLLMIGLGIVDLTIFHFHRHERNYIQTVRLFFQSPMPFAIMYFVGSISNSTRKEKLTNPVTSS